MVQVSPFDPNPASAPSQPTQAAPPTGAQTTDTGSGNDLGSQWSNWIGKPSNRAALMQFGIAMLQPIGVGQSQIGAMANAVGEGGEAAQRVEAQDIARRREDSTEDLRTQQANLAGARAGEQGALSTARQTMANAAEERARAATERIGQKEDVGRLTATIRAQGAYQQYRNEIARQNSASQFDPKYVPQTPKEFGDWVNDNPLLASQLRGGGASTQEEPVPSLQQREAVPARSFQSEMKARPEVRANIDKWRDVAKANPNDPRLQQWLQQIKPIFRDYPQLRQYLGLPNEAQ